MRIKRIMAFVVDTFIVSLMSSFIVLMPIFNYDTNKQNDILVEYIDKVTSVGSGVLDEEEMFSVMYNYASEGLILNIVSTLWYNWILYGWKYYWKEIDENKSRF